MNKLLVINLLLIGYFKIHQIEIMHKKSKPNQINICSQHIAQFLDNPLWIGVWTYQKISFADFALRSPR